MMASDILNHQLFGTLLNAFARFRNWSRENRKAYIDFIILVIASFLLIPLIYMTDATEMLYNYSRAHESWQLDDIVLSLALGSFFIAIFATRRWVDAVNFLHQSNTDSLTGLYNRRKGWEVLETELQRAKRYHRPLTMILFDIDKYKEVNDTFGHAAGDKVLNKVARAVQADLRASDTLVRWGGDEFVIISIETDLSTARQLAERLRDTIENISLPGIGKTTASFGVAQLEPNDDYNSFTRRADDRMYEAKTQGRNRVV